MERALVTLIMLRTKQCNVSSSPGSPQAKTCAKLAWVADCSGLELPRDPSSTPSTGQLSPENRSEQRKDKIALPPCLGYTVGYDMAEASLTKCI